MKLSVLLMLILLLSVSGCGVSDSPQPLAVDPVAEAPRSQHEIKLSASYAVEGSDKNEMILPQHKPPKPTTKEELVIYNCFLVRDAAEAFAAEFGGRYPKCVGCPAPSGKELIDFLPGGRLLWNPFLEARCDPNNGFPGYPGETGYTGLRNRNQQFTGYRIEGRGARDIIVVIEKNPTTGRRGTVIIPPSKEDLGAD